MLREMITPLALMELADPEALVDAAERIALEDAGGCERRPWVENAARVEGAVLLYVMWHSDESYSAFKRFLGLVGVPALVSPRRYLDAATTLAYADADACEWKPWVYRATRLTGLLYVLLALRERRRGD